MFLGPNNIPKYGKNLYLLQLYRKSDPIKILQFQLQTVKWRISPADNRIYVSIRTVKIYIYIISSKDNLSLKPQQVSISRFVFPNKATQDWDNK